MVIVDNTNTRIWEFEHYVLMAAAAGFAVRVVETRCESEADARAAAGRNAHGVPAESVLAMWRRFEPWPSACCVDVADPARAAQDCEGLLGV